jgi:hypothetical protein
MAVTQTTLFVPRDTNITIIHERTEKQKQAEVQIILKRIFEYMQTYTDHSNTHLLERFKLKIISDHHVDHPLTTYLYPLYDLDMKLNGEKGWVPLLKSVATPQNLATALVVETIGPISWSAISGSVCDIATLTHAVSKVVTEMQSFYSSPNNFSDKNDKKTTKERWEKEVNPNKDQSLRSIDPHKLKGFIKGPDACFDECLKDAISKKINPTASSMILSDNFLLSETYNIGFYLSLALTHNNYYIANLLTQSDKMKTMDTLYYQQILLNGIDLREEQFALILKFLSDNNLLDEVKETILLQVRDTCSLHGEQAKIDLLNQYYPQPQG